jgi:hypothetical protein
VYDDGGSLRINIFTNIYRITDIELVVAWRIKLRTKLPQFGSQETTASCQQDVHP